MTSLAAAAVLAGGVLTPPAASAAVRPAATGACATKFMVTGGTVAVRRPAWNDGPVHHYVHRGDVLTSRTAAIARTPSGPDYRKCGRTGSTWRVMHGGQVPATCLRRI
ncbi:hypothetical protein [Streptomyces sp. NPDC059759]|uniref:hypothetical protein n=1 Tax=Streptomyces sp. NPDC059759 TaxID=3346936 RepID=UPI00365838B4